MTARVARLGSQTRHGRILRACLLDDVDDLRRLLPGADRDVLLDAARYHRVIGFVHRALRKLDDADDETKAAFASLNRQGAHAHLRVLGALRQASAALESRGIPWLVVKGPVLSATAYREPGLRLYFDLDLVVRRSDFRDAIEALEEAEFFLLDANWDLIRKYLIGELVLSIRHGPEVDVHWDLLYDRHVRELVRVPVEELMARSRPLTVAGFPVQTLDQTDTLIHVAMHACKQGGDRLVWLKDIERLAVNDPPDWPELVRRSLGWRVNLFVGAMLLRSRNTLGADVPDDVVRELLPRRSWRALLATLDRIFPAERSHGLGSPATLIVRSTRPSMGSTLATAAGGMGRRAARLVTAGRLERDSAQDDPDDAASRAFPTGGEEGRRRYFEELLAER